MERDVVQRIRKVIESDGISIAALSKKMGVLQQTLNRQVSGEGAMSLSTVYKFLSYYPNVSAEWLLRGKGEMIASGQPQQGGNPAKFCGEFEIDNEGYLKLKMR